MYNLHNVQLVRNNLWKVRFHLGVENKSCEVQRLLGPNLLELRNLANCFFVPERGKIWITSMTSLSSKNDPKIRMLYIASINDLIISLINRPKGRVKSIDTNFIVRIVDGSWISLTRPSILGFKPNRPLTFTSQPDVQCDTDFQLCRLSAYTDKTRSLKTKDSISKSKKKRKRETALSAYATFSTFFFLLWERR